MSTIQLSEEGRICAALEYVPADDRDQWCRIGMSLQSELGDAGFDIWDAWSQRSERYSERDARSVWKSFKGGGITIATLFKVAREHGYSDRTPYKSLDPQEKARRDSARQAERERQAAEDYARHAKAAARAQRIWNEAEPANGHGYLRRKGVQAHDLKVGRWEKFDSETGEVRVVSEEALLVPIRDAAKRIHSLQAIFPSNDNWLGRDRDYLTGGAKEGNFFTIGKPLTVDGKKIIAICTGYATSASVHEASGHAVVVAFDDSNLLAVAEVIRERYPDADIIVFSDRDAEALGESGGTRAALKAALATNARVVVPEWTGRKGRDANDIHLDGFAWRGTTYPGKDIVNACVKFATPCRSPAFMSLLHECGIAADDLTPQPTALTVAEQADAALPARGDHDPTAPIAMGASGDLFGFWTREGKVELIRASDVFKDAGILRLHDLAYWQAYCTDAGANTSGGKYDRTMVGNALIQKSKLVGALDARNVPASVASPDVVQRELSLALMHAKPNAHAVAQVLLAHLDWQGVVWMNMFAGRAEARVDPPCGGGAGPWTDRHDMLLGAWLSAQYGVSVSKSMVVAAVGLLAHADQRHPVRDYLNSLAWDGVPRLDLWLTTFAGCEDDTYARHVGAKSLIGAVARIMGPGVKFDTMLVLEGDQGLRKSTLICALAPNEEWFTDSLDGDLGSKDAAIGLAGKWLIEVPEMATLGRTRVEVVKSFLTRRVDHFRAPHAVRAEDHPRQCAFFGTINPEADGRYLSDTTGGRRFWPVQVRSADVEALKADRDQLWAEAVARYWAGEHWWLTDEVEILAKQQQADRQESNPWAEHVERFLTRLPPDEHNREWGGIRASRVDEVSAAEIFAAITGKHMTKKDSPDARLISAALKATGWVQKPDKSRRWVHE
ncbi:VapE domain-containing protein [Ralstonia pseudosolanacearum]|uniref:VapE domain-containing protein n=1 Tax=Ralstonia pseudosolanacearum TaxID=1310165 RepID=UPI002676FDCD|nr:VapE domain-containing protein [Ralstonia pseudosolanacearum]MDO3547177.1 VapE family protein [Ralstonia pseudosolanacearum]MDO3582005.1 VapE family protein [Ralstonia pseudosolanacearum]